MRIQLPDVQNISVLAYNVFELSQVKVVFVKGL